MRALSWPPTPTPAELIERYGEWAWWSWHLWTLVRRGERYTEPVSHLERVQWSVRPGLLSVMIQLGDHPAIVAARDDGASWRVLETLAMIATEVSD